MTQPGNASGRILVVDDQLANLRVVGALLSHQGYQVLSANLGEDALRLAREQPPDLLLLDMMMPGMDGFMLLEAIRAESALRDVPAVFLTAAQDRDLVLRAFDAGAVDYVTKPFMPEELLAGVGAHVGLKLARDRLAQIARERQELVNLVAHDLKNPLASVLFAADVLRNNGCRAERVPRYLEVIHESASDALGYIRRYLEAQARVNRAAAAAPAALREIHDWLARHYALQLEAHGMRLVSHLPDACGHVAMDGLVLRQVSGNLIGNALKYAAAGGELVLEVQRGAPGTWQLRVLDRGPGIPPARRQRLFQPFVRLAAGDDAQSSGLGLALARQIVAEAGGRLWYEDRPGGGACFVVELPEAPDAPDAAPAQDAGGG
jgi:two-component system sensor histidine kinase/response regulator